MRVLTGILLGGGFSGACLAVVCYLAAVNDAAGSSFIGSNSTWSPFAAVVGAILGLVLGGISAAIITGFQLNFAKALVFEFCVNLSIAALLYLLITNGPASDTVRYPLYSLIPIGLINGEIISLLPSLQRPLN
jgi:hypothetical protein